MAHRELFDLEITTDGDIQFDSGGDIKTITGVENIQQSVGIDVLNATGPTIADRLTKSTVNSLIGDIYSILDNDPQVGTVNSVQLRNVDHGANSLSMKANVDANTEFDLTFPTAESLGLPAELDE